MKIDKVIVSSDNNHLYLDFWPLISKIWANKFNIEPVLVLIDNNNQLLKKIDTTHGKIIRYNIVDDIPIYLQTLWVRYWIPKIFPDSVCMISDIDMIPISQWYFVNQLENINNNHYVHLNPCYESYGTLPSCYHVAKGSLFDEILELHDDWSESIKYLNNLNLGRMANGKDKWFLDEQYSSNLIFKWKEKNEDKVHFLRRKDNRRIDRSYWYYDKNLLKDKFYYDSHSLRPFNQYATEILKLVNFI